MDHPSFELVDHASEVVGRDVRSLLIDSEDEVLRRTENAQLATFVSSLVVLDATERLGLEPIAVAGHSLGEYTALVASGSLSYEDGLHLVSERGAAMADAAFQAPGTMLAVLGLTDEDAEVACRLAEGGAWVANLNAPGQIVIAGDRSSLERAAEHARSLGAKRILPLMVGGAFHTPFMAPARDRLRKALATVTFHDPDPPVVANVDARPHGSAREWPGLLSAQLCAPVRWRQSLERLYADGARTFVELGPGGVLTGLAKRSLPIDAVSCQSVSTPDELERLVALWSGERFDRGAERAHQHDHASQPERFSMTERLVVSPATGRFSPVPALAGAGPQLAIADPPGEAAPAKDTIRIGVGDLVGWAGDEEVRSSFAGVLEGLLVLAGERVVAGQPVAWLRTATIEAD